MGDQLSWQSACLACTRSLVRFLHPPDIILIFFTRNVILSNHRDHNHFSSKHTLQQYNSHFVLFNLFGIVLHYILLYIQDIISYFTYPFSIQLLHRQERNITHIILFFVSCTVLSDIELYYITGTKVIFYSIHTLI